MTNAAALEVWPGKAYPLGASYDGYGTNNTFRENRVEGSVPGFGVGLYPALDNIVTCDNEAPDATEGLVGDNSHPIACQRE